MERGWWQGAWLGGSGETLRLESGPPGIGAPGLGATQPPSWSPFFLIGLGYPGVSIEGSEGRRAAVGLALPGGLGGGLPRLKSHLSRYPGDRRGLAPRTGDAEGERRMGPVSFPSAALSGASVRTGLRLPEGLKAASTGQPVPLREARSDGPREPGHSEHSGPKSVSKEGLGGEGMGQLGTWAEGKGASAGWYRVFSS